MGKEAWRIEKERLVEQYHEQNKTVVKGQTVFVGSSLMEMFPVEQWTKELGADAPVVYNRGVGGYKTTDLLPILDTCVLELEPAKVFINIGTNDLSDSSIPMEEVMNNYHLILSRIEERLPSVKIYIMAYYPVNYEAAAEEMKPCLRIRNNEKIALANEELKKLAARHGQTYIDVNAPLKDENGNLKAEYTIEGMHIKPEGYRAIFPEIMRYVRE
ncbi:MAG: GDSL-type esterase/lipase family protein [Lachnospiraceae bacterium]